MAGSLLLPGLVSRSSCSRSPKSNIRNKRRGLVHLAPSRHSRHSDPSQRGDSRNAFLTAGRLVFASEVISKKSALLFDTSIVTCYLLHRVEKRFVQLLSCMEIGLLEWQIPEDCSLVRG